LKDLKEEELDVSRLILSVNEDIKAPELKEVSNGGKIAVLYTIKTGATVLPQVLGEAGIDSPYITLDKPSAKAVVGLAALPAQLIVPAILLTADPKANPNLVPISTLLLGTIVSDRSDGLFPTIVTDERGIALGLVYSNAESISESLRTGQGVYHSRKRGLWYKGATSGDTQQLRRIELDCDQDCLKFTVNQIGNGKSLL